MQATEERSRSYAPPYGDATVYTHEARLRLHVLPYLGALPAGSLTPGVVRRWLEELEAATTATTARMSLDSSG